MTSTPNKGLLKFLYKTTHLLDAAFTIVLSIAATYYYMNSEWTSFAICVLSAMISFALFLKRPVQTLLRNKFKFLAAE